MVGHPGSRADAVSVTGLLLCPQNCLVRCEDNGYTAVVGDFGLAEKIPTYRCMGSIHPHPWSGGFPAHLEKELDSDRHCDAARRAGMSGGGSLWWSLMGQTDTFGPAEEGMEKRMVWMRRD